MPTQNQLFKEELRIADKDLDVNDLGYYRLLLSLGEQEFKIGVVSSLEHRCLALEEYRFYHPLSSEELIGFLNSIYDNHAFLKANYWMSINVMFKNSPFTLIPREFFIETDPSPYLKYTSANTQQERVIVAEQSSLDSVNIFSVNPLLTEWFEQTYYNKDINFMHQTQVFVEASKNQHNSTESIHTHLFIENGYFLISVFKDKKLELCNTFPYKTSKDFIYYVLFILDEMRIDKESTLLYIYGNVTQESDLLKLLQRYIYEVKLIDQQARWLAFSYEFDTIPHSMYFDLYGMYLCSK